MSRLAVLALLMLALGPAGAAVRVEGLVERPGEQPLAPGDRLLDALLPARVRADAYLLGAAWLHRAEIPAQRDLKTGILFELGVLERLAVMGDEPERAELFHRLAEQVLAAPVSGRRATSLDPLRLETRPGDNRLLGEGDRLLFPPRPRHVRVTGAVRADCSLPFRGLRPATAYLHDCPRHIAADPDWLYVIQPDGQVRRLGVAAWNRSPDQPLAPGAVLYVPLDGSLLEGLAKDLNRELARFIATQPLPLDGATEDNDETSGLSVDCPLCRTDTGNDPGPD